MAKRVSMKRRGAGMGVLALLGLGFWLGSKFGGFGLGDGFGFGKGPGEGAGPSTTASGDADRPAGSTRVSLTSQSQPTAAQTPPERLRVIIDKDHLLLAESPEGRVGEELDATEIAQRAKRTTGDDQGIRVRIERTKSAQAGPRGELRKALDAAGIQNHQIQEMQDYLD